MKPVFKATLWPEVASDQCCLQNHKRLKDVTNQEQCQDQCQEDDTCIGICYSHKSTANHFCYQCLDDVVQSVGNNYGFYRRLGMTILCSNKASTSI